MSRLLDRIYAELLRLYPQSYRETFAAERQDVFEQARQAAEAGGIDSLARFAIRELRDMPISALRACLREKEIKMDKIDPERISWGGLLSGVWPFVFLGPLMAVIPYISEVRQLINYESPLWLAIVIFSV